MSRMPGKRFTMPSTTITRGLALTATLLLAIPTAALAGGSPGDAGLLFLRMGMGAREAAMGGTGVASAEGASAAYWNPALLAFAGDGTSFLLQQQSWMGLFDYTAAAVTHHGSFGVLGLTFAGLFSEKIDRYSSEPVGVPEGTFSAYDLAFGASYSRAFTDELAVGMQAKIVYERIDIYSGTLLIYDVFLAWNLRHMPGLSLGVSATNLGGDMTINQQPFQPPKAVNVGGAWTPHSGRMAHRLTIAGDIGFYKDGQEKAHLGCEVKVVPELALRVGYRFKYENQGLTAGMGLRHGVLGLGYAFENITDSALDPGHRFSLEFFF